MYVKVEWELVNHYPRPSPVQSRTHVLEVSVLFHEIICHYVMADKRIEDFVVVI